MDRGKVRVFSSVLAGYTFLFGRFGRLFHIAWFPGVLFVIAGIFANELIREVNIGAMNNAEIQSALIYLMGVMSAYSLFQLAMTLVVVVGFYRVALHDFKPRTPIYFRFRNDELRTASVWFLVVVALYTLFMALVYVAIIGISGFIGVSNGTSGGADGAVLQLMNNNGGGLFYAWLGISMLVMYWAYARFFLAMPAALEHRATTIGEIWAATRGNNIRLTVYVIILVVSLIAFILALGALIMVARVTAAGILASILSPEAIGAVNERSQDIESLILGLPDWGRFLIIGLSQIGVFFAYIFFWGIVIGSASAAFRGIWAGDSD